MHKKEKFEEQRCDEICDATVRFEIPVRFGDFVKSLKERVRASRSDGETGTQEVTRVAHWNSLWHDVMIRMKLQSGCLLSAHSLTFSLFYLGLILSKTVTGKWHLEWKKTRKRNDEGKENDERGRGGWKHSRQHSWNIQVGNSSKEHHGKMKERPNSLNLEKTHTWRHSQGWLDCRVTSL